MLMSKGQRSTSRRDHIWSKSLVKNALFRRRQTYQLTIRRRRPSGIQVWKLTLKCVHLMNYYRPTGAISVPVLSEYVVYSTLAVTIHPRGYQFFLSAFFANSATSLVGVGTRRSTVASLAALNRSWTRSRWLSSTYVLSLFAVAKEVWRQSIDFWCR